MEQKTKEYIETGIEFVIENGGAIIGELLEDTIASVGVPVVSSAIILYKQKRFERNIKEMLNQINVRVTSFEEILKIYSGERLYLFKNTTVPNLMDFIVDEKQTGKIKYYVNTMLSFLKRCDSDSDFDEESYEISICTLLTQMTLSDLKDFLIIGEKFYFGKKESDSKAIHLAEKPDIKTINRKNSQGKLKNLGLIYMPTVIGEMQGTGQFLHEFQDCKLTYLGEELYRFIKEN